MSDELKPCPHCGSATAPEISNCVELESCANFDECPCETHLCVVCSVHNGGCGACGGFAASEEGTILNWNTRAAVTDEQFAVAVHNGEALQKVRTCGQPRGFIPCDSDSFGNMSFAELWCEHCDIEIDPEWQFCPSCGAKVVDVAGVGEAPC